MSGHRRTAGLLTVAAAIASVLLGAAPAAAADVFVDLIPSTVQAGRTVDIRASCRENNAPATVESPAFGSITVHPNAGFLEATARVPGNTAADGYRVRLSCPDGRSASTQLIVVAADHPKRGPATGFGGTAGLDAGNLLLAGGLGSTVLGVAVGLFALRRRSVRTRPVRGRAGG